MNERDQNASLKHFELDIGEATFAFRRKTDVIAAEAALDGFYVVRTNLPKRVLGDAATVGAYKSLAQVEQAFRRSSRVWDFQNELR